MSVVSSACSQCAIFLKKKVSHSENCFINKIAIERDPKLQHFLVSCHLLQKNFKAEINNVIYILKLFLGYTSLFKR